MGCVVLSLYINILGLKQSLFPTTESHKNKPNITVYLKIVEQ